MIRGKVVASGQVLSNDAQFQICGFGQTGIIVRRVHDDTKVVFDPPPSNSSHFVHLSLRSL